MNRIPAHLIVPVMEEFIREITPRGMAHADLSPHNNRGRSMTVTTGDGQENTPFLYPARCLAFWAGISYSRLSDVLRGKTKTVSFDDCDRLLCAMEKTHLWFEEPLSAYYECCSHPRGRVIDGHLICPECGVTTLAVAA